tara:strand:+ start:712 stop:1920 length:1209 start_codon:yes stop_codon:yes gene_type:complete
MAIPKSSVAKATYSYNPSKKPVGAAPMTTPKFGDLGGLKSPAPATTISYNPAKKKRTMQIPMGGGGGGSNVGFAWDDYDRQMALMDKIGEMSAGYSSDNTLGTTDIDYENKMITERLSPELQARYDALLARQGLSNDRVAGMGADPYEMQQYLYDQNLALKQPEQEELRNQTMEALAAKGMLGSTGGAGIYGQVEESIQRSNAQDFNDAMMQSQNMMDLERARGSGDLATAMAMGGAQIPYIQSGTQQGGSIAIGNVEGVSDASANIANLMGIEQGSKRKGLWDAMGMAGGGGGGGMFDSYIATATTQSIGEEGLRIFEDWRDYMFTALPTFTASFGRYRATAPKIVEEINKKENSKALYKEIWDDYLKPIFDMIKEDKDNPKALSDYKVMVRELTNKYLRR